MKLKKNKSFVLAAGIFAVCAITAFVIASFLMRPTNTSKEPAPEEIIDTTAPVIDGDEHLTIYKNDTSDILNHYNIHDDFPSSINTQVIGNYDSTVVGDYDLQIVAEDESQNKATKDIILSVVVDPEIAALNKPEYYIKVNRPLNVVMVYALDKNGGYSNLVKTFVSSNGKVGSETIVGTFTVTDRYEALYLVGNVWGHYAVRINGAYFFHSVPYFSKGNPNWDDLEYLEYNKLGEGASAGCVRLAVVDAKWVYDNIAYGTTVEIYDSETLPEGVVKPEAIKIDENSSNRGWDPTDPNPANPWN